MKKLFFLLTAFLVFTNVNSQILDPVKWTTKIEQKSEGVFVTYCAKGVVKRTLKALGFHVEALKGPPGKREMTRAIKM